MECSGCNGDGGFVVFKGVRICGRMRPGELT